MRDLASSKDDGTLTAHPSRFAARTAHSSG
jgi:hypothetical protein